jgi:cysteine-rich repeat protein
VPVCGDGIPDAFRGEQCDDGKQCLNGDPCTTTVDCGGGSCARRAGDGCNTFCLIESECGNGDLEPGEQCDDGDLDAGDGCSPECTFEGCGNGIYEEGLEECDRTDPGNTESRCRWDCTIWFCGDGTVDADEQCDGGVGCDANCLRTTDCGDGRRDPGEQCDDGNPTAGDGCSPTCYYEVCGNNRLDTARGEECDDGNNVSGDGCSSTCREEAVCGDGDLESPEQCDDGNTTNNDGCSFDCRLEAYCGDGKVDPGEQCDPQDPQTSSNCTSNCTLQVVR